MALLATGCGAHRDSRRPIRRAARLLFVLLLGMVGPSSVRAQGAHATERQVQAIFLFHFAQFVDWPPQTFADAQAPLCIGILGEDPFGAFLDETIRGEKVGDRPLEIHRFHTVVEARSCHILFIGRTEMSRLPRILAELKDRAILTVGDGEGFARLGGMIQFATEKNNVRLQVNVGAARTANLAISSKLLRVADIVGAGSE